MQTVTIRVRSLGWFVAGAAVSVAVMMMFVSAWRVDAAPGDDDSTYVPITPCRLADTRDAGDSPLGAAEVRTFDAHGVVGDCTIPSDAVAVALNVTALGATELSFLTFWPEGEAQPTAASLNPAPGEPPTPNAVTTPVSSSGQFNVYNDTGSVNVVIDVNGYYTASSLTELTSLAPRAAFATSPEIDEAVFVGGAANVLTTSITAPRAGTLVITGSVDASGAVDDQYTCQVLVDGFIVTGSSRASRVNWQGVDGPTDRTDNSQENCSTNTAIVVNAGEHAVDFRISGRSTAAFHSGALSVVWVPLDGTGAVPTP